MHTFEKVKVLAAALLLVGCSSALTRTQTQAMERARNSARDQAAKLGATHVVLGDMTPARRSYTVSGRAYRCGDAAK